MEKEIKPDKILIKVYKDRVTRIKYFGDVVFTKDYQRKDISIDDLNWAIKQGFQVIYIN